MNSRIIDAAFLGTLAAFTGFAVLGGSQSMIGFFMKNLSWSDVQGLFCSGCIAAAALGACAFLANRRG